MWIIFHPCRCWHEKLLHAMFHVFSWWTSSRRYAVGVENECYNVMFACGGLMMCRPQINVIFHEFSICKYCWPAVVHCCTLWGLRWLLNFESFIILFIDHLHYPYDSINPLSTHSFLLHHCHDYHSYSWCHVCDLSLPDVQVICCPPVYAFE